MGDFRPGSLFINGSMVPHAFHPYEESAGDLENPAMLVIQFSEESLGSEFLGKLEMRRIKRFIASTDQSLEITGATRERVAQMMHAMPGQGEAQRFAQFMLILDTLAATMEEDRQPLVSPMFAPSLKQETMQRIDRVKNWVGGHLDGVIELDALAALVGMSPRSFSRFFKKNTGKTLIQYVNELRIGLACRRLLQSDAGVAEICFEVGFRNLSNFNRQFLSRKKMSPREFRSRYRAELALEVKA